MDLAKRITVVDDDASVRKALTRLLKTVGYRVDGFVSAEEYLESVTNEEVDCLILDVHLPGMSGLELMAKLRQDGATLPIVFISAFANEIARQEALSCGAISFLPKPLNGEELLNVIHEAMRPGIGVDEP